MENTWPGCKRITGRGTTGGLSLAESRGGLERKKGTIMGGAVQVFQPQRATLMKLQKSWRKK